MKWTRQRCQVAVSTFETAALMPSWLSETTSLTPRRPRRAGGLFEFHVSRETENVELNVQITGTPVAVLQEWFEEHWEEAEDVSPELLQVVERHTRDYQPFETYARSLQQYFLGHEETAGEWEKRSSHIFPILARYQRDGYAGLLKRAEKYGGAFLCDGVGLGKLLSA